MYFPNPHLIPSVAQSASMQQQSCKNLFQASQKVGTVNELRHLHRQMLFPNVDILSKLHDAIAMEMFAREKLFIVDSIRVDCFTETDDSSSIEKLSQSFMDMAETFPPWIKNQTEMEYQGAKCEEEEEEEEEEDSEMEEVEDDEETLEIDGMEMPKEGGDNLGEDIIGSAAIGDPLFDGVMEKYEDTEKEEWKLGPWRRKYFASISSVYSQKRIQPRHMLSRKKYQTLIGRMKGIEQMAQNCPQVPLQHLKLNHKYRLVQVNNGTGVVEMLAERKSNRLFLSVDQLFDVLYKFHMNTRHGRSTTMYTATRKKFANITVECILKFLEGCEDCKKWNKNKKKLKTLLSPNPNKKKIQYEQFFDFQEDINAINCRHCPYKREHNKSQRYTNALRSHLKKYHPSILKQFRIDEANAIAMMDCGHPRHNKKSGENEWGQMGMMGFQQQLHI